MRARVPVAVIAEHQPAGSQDFIARRAAAGEDAAIHQGNRKRTMLLIERTIVRTRVAVVVTQAEAAGPVHRPQRG